MTPEEKDLLQKTFTLAQENNEILKKIKSSMRTGTVMRWAYWILIIALSTGSLWLIQPYINSLQSAMNLSNTGNIQSTPSGGLDLNKIIQDIKSGAVTAQ